MDDLVGELGATSVTQTTIQAVADCLTDEDGIDVESQSKGDYKYKVNIREPLKLLPALKLKVPVPRSPEVSRTPDGLGRVKLVSWASEMSMYDLCSPKSPGLPKNLPTPKTSQNLKSLYKDTNFPTLGSAEQPALSNTTADNETTDYDAVFSADYLSEETMEEPRSRKGRLKMPALEDNENGFVAIEVPSSPSSHGSESAISTSGSVLISSEPRDKENLTITTSSVERKLHGVRSNSDKSSDGSSPEASSQISSPEENRPKGSRKKSLRFNESNAQSVKTPEKPKSLSKMNSFKGQSGSFRNKVKSKKPTRSKFYGTKAIRPPVFDFQNLIINYLPPKLDSASLRHLFEQFGIITNCKVVQDHETGLSKGYGFVKFQTEDQAEKAIGKLNNYQIGGKKLKVSYARRTSKPRGAASRSGRVQHTNLYIANLDKNIDSSDLQHHFSSCGYIVQCRVLKDEQGATRRIGFVRYDTHNSALKAIKMYDGKKMDGTKSVIQVRFANSPRAPPSQKQSQAAILPNQESSTMSSPGLHSVPTSCSINGMQSAISLNEMLPNSQKQVQMEVGGHYFPRPPTNMWSSNEGQYKAGTTLSPNANLQQGFPKPELRAKTGYTPEYGASQTTYAKLSLQGNFVGVTDKQQSASNDNCGLTSTKNKKENVAACYVSGFNLQTEESMLKSTFDSHRENKVKSVRIIRRRAGPYAFVNFFNAEDAAYAADTFNQKKLGSQTLTVRLKTQW